MATESTVRILNGALDEENGDIILRGRIDPTSLEALQIDDYQREIMPLSTINGIIKGYKEGANVPDIHLSMRGTRTTDNGKTYTLKDPVFIVDGLQRVSAARQLLLEGGTPRLGATVYFGKTKEWEIQHFKTLNVDVTKLSSNIILRNLRGSNQMVATLYSMCQDDPTFSLRGRVCWQQRTSRQHLITAVSLLKVTGSLHSHLGSGLSNKALDLAPGVEKIMEQIGKNIFRSNLRTYFQLLEDCWGLRTIAFTEGAVHIHSTFMITLARLLSNHFTFWRDDERKLFVEMELVRKIKGFPIQDPTIKQLSSAGSQGGRLLYQLMIEHINSGKRTKRLRTRRANEEVVQEIKEA